MSECIIVCRNPHNRRIVFVMDEEGEPAIFATSDEAEVAAANTTICKAWSYSVVELDGI